MLKSLLKNHILIWFLKINFKYVQQTSAKSIIIESPSVSTTWSFKEGSEVPHDHSLLCCFFPIVVFVSMGVSCASERVVKMNLFGEIKELALKLK